MGVRVRENEIGMIEWRVGEIVDRRRNGEEWTTESERADWQTLAQHFTSFHFIIIRGKVFLTTFLLAVLAKYWTSISLSYIFN
jgi:hypothetical protein